MSRATMLRELNHRAKNIMQVVASVLTLEKSRAVGEEAHQALSRAAERLRTMSHVHSLLYLVGGETEECVDMAPYLKQLARAVTDGMSSRPEPIVIDVACGEFCWPVEVAGQIGMIVAEALTNACKHAFPSAGQATIALSLQRGADGMLRLEMSDNGKGFDGRNASAGIGTALLHAFAQDLGATIAIESRPGDGTRLALSFPPDAIRVG